MFPYQPHSIDFEDLDVLTLSFIFPSSFHFQVFQIPCWEAPVVVVVVVISFFVVRTLKEKMGVYVCSCHQYRHMLL